MNNFKIKKRQIIIITCICLILLGMYLIYNSYDFAYNLSSSSKYTSDTIVGDLGIDLLLLRVKSYSNMFLLTGSISLLTGLNSLINMFTKQ
ncbi:MAG: hypothetical protein RSD36_17615 [Terrisporobacter sp.]